MDKFFETTALLPNAFLPIRYELDLPISNNIYFEIFSKHIEEGKLVFDTFLKKNGLSS